MVASVVGARETDWCAFSDEALGPPSVLAPVIGRDILSLYKQSNQARLTRQLPVDMRPAKEAPRGPGGLLQEWHRGSCQWFQNVTRSAQELHQRLVRESAAVLQHIEQHKPVHKQRRAPASAFASLSASAPTLHANTVRFRGKGMNCIISDLADNSLPAQPSKPHAPGSIEEQERILVSEVR